MATFKSMACEAIAEGGGVYAAIAFGKFSDAARFAAQSIEHAEFGYSTSTYASPFDGETVRPARGGK